MRALLLCLAAVVVAPPSAGAAVVTLAYEPPIPGVEPRPAYALDVHALAGEPNFLGIVHGRGAYTVRDFAAPITPGRGCTRADARTVRCATPRTDATHSVFVQAGDRVDFAGVGALVPGSTVELRGGPDGDHLVGDTQNDRLVGGEGDDRIAGQGGRDTIVGGSGNDGIDGGAGRDQISYEERRAPVRVDLEAESGGAEGELDRLERIENVIGGGAADLLAGDSGPNTILGGPGPGRDHMFGRGGDDTLTGHRVSGGRGDDSLDARLPACDRGTDRLIRVLFKTRGPFPRSCEHVVAGAFLELTPDPVSRTRRMAVYRLRCVAAFGRCAGTLELRDRRGRLGRRRFARPDSSAARPTRVFIPLSRSPRGRVGTLRVDARPAYRGDEFRTRLR